MFNCVFPLTKFPLMSFGFCNWWSLVTSVISLEYQLPIRVFLLFCYSQNPASALSKSTSFTCNVDIGNFLFLILYRDLKIFKLGDWTFQILLVVFSWWKYHALQSTFCSFLLSNSSTFSCCLYWRNLCFYCLFYSCSYSCGFEADCTCWWRPWNPCILCWTCKAFTLLEN